MRDELDKFYTDETVAKECIRRTLYLFDGYDHIVEPSAGSGSFSNNLNGCYAFDMEPTAPGIVKQNWLDITAQDFPSYERMLIIGNPPFGKRSVLAKQFIKHSISALNATTIAFILPKTFNKRINQNVFPINWRLVDKITLTREENMFTLYGDDDLFIPCDYFIWTRDDTILPGVDLREQRVEIPEELVFLPRGAENTDVTLNGNNGKVKDPSEVTNPKSEHYIKVAPGYDKETVINRLRSLKHNFHSSVNGGVAWVNKEDISRAFRN